MGVRVRAPLTRRVGLPTVGQDIGCEQINKWGREFFPGQKRLPIPFAIDLPDKPILFRPSQPLDHRLPLERGGFGPPRLRVGQRHRKPAACVSGSPAGRMGLEPPRKVVRDAAVKRAVAAPQQVDDPAGLWPACFWPAGLRATRARGRHRGGHRVGHPGAGWSVGALAAAAPDGRWVSVVIGRFSPRRQAIPPGVPGRGSGPRPADHDQKRDLPPRGGLRPALEAHRLADEPVRNPPFAAAGRVAHRDVRQLRTRLLLAFLPGRLDPLRGEADGHHEHDRARGGGNIALRQRDRPAAQRPLPPAHLRRQARPARRLSAAAGRKVPAISAARRRGGQPPIATWPTPRSWCGMSSPTTTCRVPRTGR